VLPDEIVGLLDADVVHGLGHAELERHIVWFRREPGHSHSGVVVN
jgi:hypothetical protein